MPTKKRKPGKRPGSTAAMQPKPKDTMAGYQSAQRFQDKAVLITGGDSGIGRAVAIAFAKEGADISIIYRSETQDAEITKAMVEAEGRRCLLIKGDIGAQIFCVTAVKETFDAFGRIDVLINNAGEQHPQEDVTDISEAQLERTFRTNVYGMFFMTKAVRSVLKKGSSIINTSSVTAYQGHDELLDYAATKGAIVAFTYSLAQNLAKEGIRVNAVAPGPIWTPLITETFDAKKIKEFGENTPMGRPGQPNEVAPCFVFLASDDASYITGQVLHPNGGRIVNG
jgi:NAD(P)-dependent dehydrogenase (short-subunit alcohol dehydrogenase family)